MTVLRQNRYALVLALLLAAIFAVGAPARVLAAADRCLPATDHSATVCMMTGQANPCCCVSGEPAGILSGAAVGRPHHCVCSLQAPPPTPPATAEGVAPAPLPDAVAALPASLPAPPPLIALWTLSNFATGPPDCPCTSLLRSRAPPAC